MSASRLPGRSGISSVRSSRIRTKPVGSPRGETSTPPPGSFVATQTNGERSTNWRVSSFRRSAIFDATTAVGAPMISRSSASSVMARGDGIGARLASDGSGPCRTVLTVVRDETYDRRSAGVEVAAEDQGWFVVVLFGRPFSLLRSDQGLRTVRCGRRRLTCEDSQRSHTPGARAPRLSCGGPHLRPFWRRSCSRAPRSCWSAVRPPSPRARLLPERHRCSRIAAETCRGALPPAVAWTSLPAAAQSAISAALGADSREFSARSAAGGYRLSGGGVTAELGKRHVTLRTPGTSLSMSVAGLGRGARLDAPAAPSLHARANRVSLERDGLTEWYAAGPLGIEQGFTLSAPPRRECRPGHARAEARGRRARTPRRVRQGLPHQAGAAAPELRRALGDRRERARAPRRARDARRDAHDPGVGSRRGLPGRDRPADPAGAEADGKRRERRRRLRVRGRALVGRQHRAHRRPVRQQRATARPGCSCARAPPGRSRAGS